MWSTRSPRPEMSDENNVVIAHELLHTVGATDKYDAADGRTEISGWLRRSETESAIPRSGTPN